MLLGQGLEAKSNVDAVAHDGERLNRSAALVDEGQLPQGERDADIEVGIVVIVAFVTFVT